MACVEFRECAANELPAILMVENNHEGWQTKACNIRRRVHREAGHLTGLMSVGQLAICHLAFGNSPTRA